MKHIESYRLWMLSAAVFLAAGAAVPARAQDPDDLKRGVARISLMDGDVSVRRGDSGDWVAGRDQRAAADRRPHLHRP